MATDLAKFTEAAAEFFRDRQNVECSVEPGNSLSLKLLQWGNEKKVFKVKLTDCLPRFLEVAAEDLSNADYVLFVVEPHGWREAYAVQCDELKKILGEEPKCTFDINSIPTSSYVFFDLLKVHKYMKDA